MAFCVEDAVNSTYDNENDKKGYKDKLKSLSFNLKQNHVSDTKIRPMLLK